MALSKEKIRLIQRTLLVILGSFVLGIGTGFFLVPYNIVTGGITGIAIIVHSLTQWDTEITVTVLTWACFFIGWLLLGTKFAANTIISAIVYPFALMLGSHLSSYPALRLDTILTVAGVEYASVNYLIAAIFGGIFVGTGCGLTFLGGGSTGGVDIFVLAIQKYFGVKTGITSFLVDASIILLGLIFVNKLDATLMGIVSAFFASMMINRIFDSERNVAVSIISERYQEINAFILEKLDRGSTIVNAIGGYSERDLKMIQVVLDFREYSILQEIVAKVDPKAFMYMTKVSSVRGEGFKGHAISETAFRKKKRKRRDEKDSV